MTFSFRSMARECLFPWDRLQTSTTRTPRRRKKTAPTFLVFNPDGSNMQVYAYGIRNCVGLGVNPLTGELWCSTNERDGLGDNLAPDYITHVQEGGFYGWPWWYMGGNQDPRHKGKHPELKDKVITPDVLVNPHNASLGNYFLRWQTISGAVSGRSFRVGAWLVEPGGSCGLRIDPRISASDGPCQRRISGFHDRLRGRQRKCLGTPGWCHHGSRRLAAGHRRRFEFHLEDQLHRKVSKAIHWVERGTMPDSLFSRRKLLKAAGAARAAPCYLRLPLLGS